MAAEPWLRFAVGTPSTRANWTNNNCQRLVSVAHVAHVSTAFRIVEDGRLRADLIFDESRLNTERIRVVWLSPNDWANAGGFRYGNVRFSFDWEPFIVGKRAYWIEDIAYGIPACRILITDRDYGGTLMPYDPVQVRGPWSIGTDGIHYWNGEYCLEIMYEGDLLPDRATRVDFVRHHAKRCSVDFRTCPDLGRGEMDAEIALLGTIVADNRPFNLPGILQVTDGVPRPGDVLRHAHSLLYASCGNLRPRAWGPLRASDAEAPAVARALLRSLASRTLNDDALVFASRFQSAEEAGRAITELFARAAGLPDPRIFFEW